MHEIRDLITRLAIKFNRKNEYYFDFTEIVNDGGNLQLIVDCLLEETSRLNADTVIGIGYGGAQLISALGARGELNTILVRNEPHKNQQGRQVEGEPEKANRIVIVDDAVFSGASIRNLISIVGEDIEKKIVGALVIFDDLRFTGSRQLRQLFPVKGLVDREELGITRKAVGGKSTISKIKLSPDKLRWADYAGNSGGLYMKSSPCIHEGLVINCTDRYVLSAYDLHSGQKKWAVDFPGAAYQDPNPKGMVQNLNVCEDGFMYVGAYDGSIKKVNANTGETNWTIKTGIANHATPTYVPTHNLVITSCETYQTDLQRGSGYLCAVSSDSGKLIWKHQFPDYPPATPLVSKELIYVCANDRSLACISLDGTTQWRIFLKREVKAEMLILGDFLFCVDMAGWLYKIGTDGRIAWEIRACASGWQVSPKLHGKDIVVWDAVGSANSLIYGYDPETGSRTWLTRCRTAVAAVTKVTDNELLAASTDAKLAYFVDRHKVWETPDGASSTAASAPAIDLNSSSIAFNLRTGGLHVYNI